MISTTKSVDTKYGDMLGLEILRDITSNISVYLRMLMQTFDIMDVFDIIIVAFIVYRVLTYMRRTNASSVMKGVVFLLLASGMSNLLQLNSINYLLRQAIGMGVLVLAILFQPELRRLFVQLGNSRFNFFSKSRTRLENMRTVLQNVVSATVSMAQSKTGALIIFEREIGLTDYAVTGVRIDSDVSSELIQNIFYHNSPLHDGALLIRDGRILAAGCMLPLSNNINLARDLGMRHRAGVGISERSDAIAIIVSEEHGTISVAIDGMIKRNLPDDTYELLLNTEFFPESERRKRSGKTRVNML